MTMKDIRTHKLSEDKLAVRNHKIVRLYSQGITPGDIAARVGVTSSRVYKIIQEAKNHGKHLSLV